MAEKVVSKLRGNMWRLIILAVAGSLIYGLPYFRTYYYDAYLQAYNPVSYTHLTLPTSDLV